MKKIGIYPGNFQPATQAHLRVYKQLRAIVGPDSFVAITDREPTPDAPLNFGDKEQIWVRHGVPGSYIVKVATLPIDHVEKASEWRPTEVFNNFSGEHTVEICVLNEQEAGLFSKRKGYVQPQSGMTAGTLKEVQNIFRELADSEKDRQSVKPEADKVMWIKPDGTPQYFQPYRGNEYNLRPFKEHAYVVILDDSRIDGKPISTANIRSVLGSSKYGDKSKKKFFRWVFGWFDIGLYQLVSAKFKMAHQVASPENTPLPPIATNVDNNNSGPATAYPQSVSNSRVYNPQRKLEELVYEILGEIMDEDYSTTINDPSSSSTDGNLTGGMDGKSQESPAQQKANAAKTKQSLVQKKQKAERDLKGLQTDLKWKQSDVLRKRKDELPGKRKELDTLNKQIAASSSANNTAVV